MVEPDRCQNTERDKVREDGELSDSMMWLLTAPARRDHQHDHSSGHVWQGRFKAFPVQEDDHLPAVLRSVKRNPVRASLAGRARGWMPGRGVRPEGWEEVLPSHPTLGDVNSAEALAEYQAAKRAHKAKVRAEQSRTG